MGAEEQWLVHLKETLSKSELEVSAVRSKPTGLELEAVCGCVGASGKGLCHFVSSREVVFPAATACVLVSADGQKQRLFKGHSQEVTSLCVHPNGRLIASGSRSKASSEQVVRWRAL